MANFSFSSGCEEKHDEEEEEEKYSDEGSLLGESWKTALPRFQKLLKNLSQLFGKSAIKF